MKKHVPTKSKKSKTPKRDVDAPIPFTLTPLSEMMFAPKGKVA